MISILYYLAVGLIVGAMALAGFALLVGLEAVIPRIWGSIRRRIAGVRARISHGTD